MVKKLRFPQNKITHKLFIFLIVTSLIPIITLVSIVRVYMEKQLIQYQHKEFTYYKSQFNYLLDKKLQRLNLITYDYAVWEEAYFNTKNDNIQWLQNNIVDWLLDNHDFDYAAIVDNSQQLIIENINGFYGDFYTILSSNLDQIKGFDFIYIDDQLYIATIAQITPSKNSPLSAGQLILAKKIDKSFITGHLYIPGIKTNLLSSNKLLVDDVELESYLTEHPVAIEDLYQTHDAQYHFIPITNHHGEVLLHGVIEIPYRFYRRSLTALRHAQMLSYSLVILFFIISIFFVKKQFINPINHVKEVINQIRATKTPIPIELTRTDEFGELAHIFNELTLEIDSYNNNLKHLSITDEVTDLYNKRHLDNTLDDKISKNESFILVYLEIDFMKSYSNLFKRSETDSILCLIAKLIKKTILAPLLFRIDSSTFAVITEETNVGLITEYIQSFQNNLTKMDFYGKNNLPSDLINASAGITLFPEESSSKDALIRVAENKLYNAKNFLPNKIGSYYSVFHDTYTKEKTHDLEDAYQLSQVLLSVIQCMDQYTLCHSEGVAQYALEIGTALHFPPEDMKLLQYGALLHDVGKIELGSSLLNKVGKLSEEEFNKIKNHPIFGVNILSAIPALHPILPIVKHHHEWYNGKGYPAGLKKDDIPLLARVVSVADAYDSMVTNRPYRTTSKTAQEALDELARCSGTQFDPMIVSTFLKLQKNKKSA